MTTGMLLDAAELLADGCLGIREAAAFSGLSRSTLYAAMDRGHLRFVTRGRRRLIPKRELIRYLSEGLRGRAAVGNGQEAGVR